MRGRLFSRRGNDAPSLSADGVSVVAWELGANFKGVRRRRDRADRPTRRVPLPLLQGLCTAEGLRAPVSPYGARGKARRAASSSRFLLPSPHWCAHVRCLLPSLLIGVLAVKIFYLVCRLRVRRGRVCRFIRVGLGGWGLSGLSGPAD